MEDRRVVRGTLVRDVSIELVVEDGAHRSVGERADLDGPRGGGFQTCDAERPRQTQDAEAGSEALFRMRPLLQDEIAERGGCWPDEGGVPADTVRWSSRRNGDGWMACGRRQWCACRCHSIACAWQCARP